MSATAKFLQLQYQIGRVTAEQIQALVGSRLTQAEAEEITSQSQQSAN